MKVNADLERRHGGWFSRWAFCALLAWGVLALTQSPIAGAADRPERFHPVDLSRSAGDTFVISPEQSLWSDLPRGAQTFGGVPFRVERKVQVTGLDAARQGDFYPPRVAGIQVGRKARRLHLLHATEDVEKDGVPVAKLVLHYAGGVERTVRLGYGVQLRSWQKAKAEKTSVLADPGSVVVWTNRSEPMERAGSSFRLYATALENPLPDEEMQSLEVISLFSRAAPAIFAVTVEEGDAAGGIARPEQGRRRIRRMNDLPDSAYVQMVSVRVRDAVGGAALSNAWVHLTVSDDQSSFYFGSVQADARGLGTLPYPVQQTVAFTIQARAVGHIPASVAAVRETDGEFRREYTASLSPGVRIGGLVREENGQPVSGAEVVIARVAPAGPKEFVQTDFDVVMTDRAGRWSSSSLPAAFSGLQFQLNHPEFRPAVYFQAEESELGPGRLTPTNLSVGDAVLVLRRGIRVEGRLADGGGQAVTNAQLFWGRGGTVQKRQSSRIEAGGRFSWSLHEEGPVSLAVLAPGYAPKFQTFQAGPGMKPLEVVLTRASLLRLQVRDSEQRPVPGAIVKAESWHNSPLLTWWKQTDAEGRCTWDAPPGDRVQFMITASNYFSARTEVMTAREAVLSVRKISRVFGKVADAETGRPVDEFRIIRGRSYSPGEPIRWERYNTTRGQGGEYSVRLDDNGSGQMEVLIEAPGYLPGTSPALTKPGWYTNDFLLHKGKGVSGVVRSAKGDLVGNATVILVDSSENAYMNEPGQFQSGGGNGDSVRTDAQGRFEFYPRLETDTVVVSHEQGFAEVRVRQMTTNAQVVLQPWGRVEGVLRVGRTVEPHQTVALNNGFSQGGEEGRSSPALSIYLRVDPDPQGKFVFEKVPPGERKVYLQYKFRDGPGQTPLSHGVPVLVQPGGTAEVTLGGSGRAVIGRVAVTGGEPDDVDWLRDVHTLSLRLPPRPAMQPVNVAGKTQEEQQKFWREYQEREQAFWRSEGGRALERAQRSYVLVFGSNATFRVDSVPPGTYDLMIRPTDPQYEYYNNQELGALSQEVVVPAAPAGRAGEPFDLGTVELRTKRIARVGRLAPSFEAKTVEGKVVKLEELRGKYVLLDFWAMWGGTRGSELQVLKGLHDTYGKEGRLVVIGLNLDGEAKPAAEFAKSNEMPWTQWYLGSWGQTPVPALFGVDGVPHAILLDPAGKIVAKNLRGSTIRSAVRNALGESQKAVSR